MKTIRAIALSLLIASTALAGIIDQPVSAPVAQPASWAELFMAAVQALM